jgi:uncharacterized protein YhaN
VEKDVRKRKVTPARTKAKERLPTLNEVEAQIQMLEAELETLNMALAQSRDDFQEQAKLGDRYRQLQTELEHQLTLWERVAQSP